jgi:hypothetical protein
MKLLCYVINNNSTQVAQSDEDEGSDVDNKRKKQTDVKAFRHKIFLKYKTSILIDALFL